MYCLPSTVPLILSFSWSMLVYLFGFFFVIFFLVLGLSFFFLAVDGIRVWSVTGVQTCALPISLILILDLHADRVDRNKDQRDIHHDRTDLNKDRADRNADQRDINHDKKDLSKDRKDRNQDQKDINKDKKDLHKDRKDLRHDKRGH